LQEGAPAPGETLGALEKVLRARRENPPEGSYTAKLFADEALRHKKVGEEATELVIASLKGDKKEIAHEAADLLYHALVVLQAHGMGLADVAEFGLRWQDCEEFLRRLGYRAKVIVSSE